MTGALLKARERARVDGGGGDDDPQVRALRRELQQPSEEEIDVQASFVSFVDDHGVVLGELWIALHLRQQDAVGHEFHSRSFGGTIVKPDFASDFLTPLHMEFLGQPPGNGKGGHAPGLGASDEGLDSQPRLQAHLGQLGRFPRTRLSRDDHHGMVAERVHDLVLARGDGKIGRIIEGQRRGCAPCPAVA